MDSMKWLKEKILGWLSFTDEIKARDKDKLNELSKLADLITSEKYMPVKEKISQFVDGKEHVSEIEFFDVLANRDIRDLSEDEKKLVLEAVSYLCNTYAAERIVTGLFQKHISDEFQLEYRCSPFSRYDIKYNETGYDVKNWSEVVYLIAEAVYSMNSFRDHRTVVFDFFSSYLNNLGENEFSEINSIIQIKIILFGYNFLYKQYGLGVNKVDDVKYICDLTKCEIEKFDMKFVYTDFYELNELDDDGMNVSYIKDGDELIDDDLVENEYMRRIIEDKGEVEGIVSSDDELLIALMGEGIYIPGDDGDGVFIEISAVEGITEDREGLIIKANSCFVCHEDNISFSGEEIERRIRNPFNNKMIMRNLRRLLCGMAKVETDIENEIEKNLVRHEDMTDDMTVHMYDDSSAAETDNVQATVLLTESHMLIDKSRGHDFRCLLISEDKNEWMIFFNDHFVCKADGQIYAIGYSGIDSAVSGDDDELLVYFSPDIFEISETIFEQEDEDDLDEWDSFRNSNYKKIEAIHFKGNGFNVSEIADFIQEILYVV